MLESIARRLEGGAPLVARLAVGTCMVAHGYGKALELKGFIHSVEAHGIPFPEVLGPAAAFSELFGGALLLFGLFTRPAALFVAVTMGVAVFHVHWDRGYWSRDGGFEYPLTLMLVAVSILLSGPGPVSLDQAVRGRR